MSTYTNRTRRTRELSPKTIAVRIALVIFLIALFFAIFVLPWMFA
jgi:hypothetical protein